MKPNNLRKQLDSDPELLELIRSLALLGCKAPTLKKLGLAIDYSDRVVEKCVANLQECAYPGNPFKRTPYQSASNSTFLKEPEERYHASVIHALSQRINLSEKIAQKRYPHALVAIYRKYLETFDMTAHNAVLSFNDMVEVINGVRTGNVIVAHCSNCQVEYLSNPLRPAIRKCYFCVAHSHPAFNMLIIEGQSKRMMNG